MSDRQPQTPKSTGPYHIWPGASVLLIVLSIVVLILMFIAWAMPAATPRAPETTLTIEQTEVGVTATPDPTLLTPTNGVNTSEAEVGYANGIIVISGMLMLILLLATLREVLWHHKKTTEGLDPDAHD